MWAAAVYDLGLTDSQFWDLTPRHFRALWDRRLDEHDRQNRIVCQLLVLYANTHRDTNRRLQPFTLDDFAPLRLGPRRASIADADHCPECGLHAYHGHTEECGHGKALTAYNLSQMTMFAKLNPETAECLTT